jgi:ADP-ribose pyrophosphatase YjhB (NUDIX family)
MTKILFLRQPGDALLKSHVKGYSKKNGTYVGPYENKVAKKLALGSILHEKPEGYHPARNDNGHKVAIKKLSTPTPAEHFSDPKKIATVVPGGATPEELNGVKFEPWHDAPTTLHEWADVEGQNLEDEPDFEPIKGMKQGSGVIIQEPDGRVWVVHPTNQFGGYSATFPKGTLEDGLPLQASAIKEAYEESGLKVEITGFVGDIKRTTSVARYYTARRVGGTPSAMGWESQATSLVPAEMLPEIANSGPDAELIKMLNSKK